MARILYIILFLSISFVSNAQQMIAGKIRDQKGRPISGASIGVKDGYDGGTSDSTGSFRFVTSEKGEQILTATSIGYKPNEVKITIGGSTTALDIILKEEPNELKAVVVTAGTFEAGDTKRTTVLSSLDIVTTASANADITGAIKTLPGTQQVGEKEGLFVRGGTGEEAKVFIDGTVVNNFFFSSIPDIATRGRFSPFLFKGTVFSSGGYSALYGQALSGALILETVDLPDRSSANLGISTVGLSMGYQQLAKDKKSSWGINYNYTNLAPYFAVAKTRPDYFEIPQFHNLEGNFRVKTSKTGIIKFYAYSNYNRLGLRRGDIDSTNLKDAFSLNNVDLYTNLSYKEKLGKHWRMNLGMSYSTNVDKLTNELQDQDNQKQVLNNIPYDTKNFNLQSNQDLSQFKAVFERKLAGLSAIRFGGEYLYARDKNNYNSDFVKDGRTGLTDQFTSAFAETDIYITYGLAAKIGGRFEYSSIMKKPDVAPRVSLAYKVGEGQFSLAYGQFYQKPDRNFLYFSQGLQYQSATHYILNYQRVSHDYTIRGELFYKKYHDLVKTFPDTTSTGDGYAKGFEVFWRDRKTFKNVDYWISYSYLDSKRNYLNYPMSIQPNFAARHTASLVVKKFITKLKTQFNASYTYATGRPYYNIMLNGNGTQYQIADQGKTISYNNMGLSVNYLPSIGNTNAKRFVVWVLSVSNPIGSNQVYNYNYSYNGGRKEAVIPPSRRFYFIGCFISFGVDRSEDVINSNL